MELVVIVNLTAVMKVKKTLINLTSTWKLFFWIFLKETERNKKLIWKSND